MKIIDFRFRPHTEAILNGIKNSAMFKASSEASGFDKWQPQPLDQIVADLKARGVVKCVIPGFNDDEETARSIGRLLKGYANVSYEALPYHRLGTQKYMFLGREYLMGDVSLPAGKAEMVQAIVDEERGVK